MNSTNPTPLALVVDDNPDAAETLALLIELEGFNVVTADSLSSARERLAQLTPRLVLLDHRLPDGSGLELMAELNALREKQPLDVVMLTGAADPARIQEAQRLGVSGYLIKPVRIEDLVDVLARARQ